MSEENDVSNVIGLPSHRPQMELYVWSNGRDLVIAADVDGAREFARQVHGHRAAIMGELETADGWGIVPDEMPITIVIDDEKLTLTAGEWVARNGLGYLGTVPGAS